MRGMGYSTEKNVFVSWRRENRVDVRDEFPELNYLYDPRFKSFEYFPTRGLLVCFFPVEFRPYPDDLGIVLDMKGQEVGKVPHPGKDFKNVSYYGSGSAYQIDPEVEGKFEINLLTGRGDARALFDVNTFQFVSFDFNVR